MFYKKVFFKISRISQENKEFKGSVWHVQKVHTSLITQVDLIPLNQWKFKALETNDLKQVI